MATTQAENIGDLVATTLRKLGRGKFTDLSIDLQRLPAFDMFSKKGMHQLKDDTGGYGFEWRLLMRTSNNNRLVGLFEPSNIQPMDGMVVAQAPFRNITGGYAFEHRELDMNKGESRIVDLIQERRLQDKIDFAQKFEGYFWRAPTNTSLDLWSLPYWCVKNATEGFNGGLPTGFSTVANIVPDTYGSKWKNYTAPFTNVSRGKTSASISTGRTTSPPCGSRRSSGFRSWIRTPRIHCTRSTGASSVFRSFPAGGVRNTSRPTPPANRP